VARGWSGLTEHPGCSLGEVGVLAVTNGDGGAEAATSPHELGRRRAHRSVSYQRLGGRQVRRYELALRSNTISDAEADVVAALSEILGFDPDPCAAWVLAPWQHDGHADHDAVGRAAAAVCHAYRARLVEYLVTSWSSDRRAARERAPMPHTGRGRNRRSR
jgi:LmbE family N-acetylglucosaminyl deacetylase